MGEDASGDSAAADRLKSKKASQREDWFNKNFNEHEDKILKKYKFDNLTLYGILKAEVLHVWPTESPADRAAAQVVFDPKILRDEMYAWPEAHPPGSALVQVGGSGDDFANRVQVGGGQWMLSQKSPSDSMPCEA